MVKSRHGRRRGEGTREPLGTNFIFILDSAVKWDWSRGSGTLVISLFHGWGPKGLLGGRGGLNAEAGLAVNNK